MIVYWPRVDCKKATLDIHLKLRFSIAMSAIKQVVDDFSGGQAALARELGISPQAVSQWVRGRRPVPPRLAIRIESATGGAVSRHDLRPDIFGPSPTQQGEAA